MIQRPVIISPHPKRGVIFPLLITKYKSASRRAHSHRTFATQSSRCSAKVPSSSWSSAWFVLRLQVSICCIHFFIFESECKQFFEWRESCRMQLSKTQKSVILCPFAPPDVFAFIFDFFEKYWKVLIQKKKISFHHFSETQKCSSVILWPPCASRCICIHFCFSRGCWTRFLFDSKRKSPFVIL